MMNLPKTTPFIFIIVFFSCSSDSNMPEPSAINLPELSIRDSRIFEKDGNSMMQFEVFANTNSEQAINIAYTLEGITAEPRIDFVADNGTIVLAANSNKAIIEITVLDDAIKEVDEKISITITSPDNAPIKNATATGIIQDNDTPVNFDEEGYQTPNSYYGYNMEWQDEFDGENLNLDNYSYDLGDGCPDLCGWGNNELEWYTDEPKNIFLEEGKLVIRATKEGTTYNSAKIHTKDKQRFQFGRIDVRAKLPEGQGLWPAIWMLGQNIDQVGWPACGEIDIMELVGHEPKKTHGTAHWGPIGGPNKFSTVSYSLDDKFSENFHVFSIVWELNEIIWYLDELKIHSINTSSTQGELYPFNQTFYLIFNVAVGGNWPGKPDDTTVFPQQMDIDYVRYFKRT